MMCAATVVITGANRGIGLELARGYRERGERVIGLCRRSSDALEASGAEVIDGVDVTSADALRDAAAQIERPVDVFVACAGILADESFEMLGDAGTAERIRRQFEVNALGALLSVHAFADGLRRGSKVVLITSRMGSIADNTSGGRYGYRMSKAALNAGARSLALDLEPRGIAVAILHPGYVRTDMTGGRGLLDPPESAAMLIARIDELALARSGGFRPANGETLPW